MKIGPFEPKSLPTPVSGERKVSSTAKTEAVSGSAKVERIAQAIRDGKLTVNAGAIADKLIANAQELLDRTPRT